eukprot:9387699-Ditylum_brightwellii.AAC.1
MVILKLEGNTFNCNILGGSCKDAIVQYSINRKNKEMICMPMCFISISSERVILKGILGGCVWMLFCSFFKDFVFTMPKKPLGTFENSATVLKL